MRGIKIYFASIAVLVAVLAVIGNLRYHGVCISKGRVLSDEEKIRAVIEEINNSPARSVPIKMPDKSTRFTSYKRIPYPSVDDFLAKNPDCCEINVRETSGSGRTERSRTLSRMMGIYAGHVTVNYTLHYLDEEGRERRTQDKLIYSVQNCGVVNSN